jgi:chromosome segregation ATPase
MKNDNQIKEDINGRIHSLDQGFRSLEKRLRAIERRISAGDIPEGSQLSSDPELEREIESIRADICAITERLDIKTGNNYCLTLEDQLNATRQQIMELSKHIELLNEDNSRLHSLLDKDMKQDCDLGYEQLSTEFRCELASLGQRLDKAENQNRIHIGSMKVPLEMSGIVGALVLALTGGLIIAGKWDIIRSPYFSFSIALALAVAVLIKFYFANNSKA